MRIRIQKSGLQAAPAFFPGLAIPWLVSSGGQSPCGHLFQPVRLAYQTFSCPGPDRFSILALPFLKVQGKRNQGIAFLRDGPVNFLDFLFIQQQLAGSAFIMVIVRTPARSA